MFYEYSITPDVFDPASLGGNPATALILTQLLRGICENGMISDLHKSGWSRDIAKRVEGIPSQKTKANVMKLLEVLKDRKRLVRHPKAANDPADDVQWFELAREAHGRAPLDAIVLTPNLLASCGIDDEILIGLDDVLDSDPWLHRRRSATIKQQEADYRNLLPKVLRHAKRLWLIDPYFRPDRRQWTDTIEICASLMGQRGGDVLRGIIEVHTGDPGKRNTPLSPKDEITAWDQWKKDHFTPNYPHTLSVSMWGSRVNGERFHDRLLITDQVGFQIAGGLDCMTPPIGTPSDTVWTLLDEKDRLLWLGKFQEGTSPYDRITT